MIAEFTRRMLTEPDPRVLHKFTYNCGFKGVLSVNRFKKRLKQGIHFPPFLFISIINSCQLHCKGCWVDVKHPRTMMTLDELNRIINDAKKHGNYFFGLLGGEPFLHPQLMDLLEAHPDCYFQIFTNGQFISDDVAKRLRKLGNATPLISIEGTALVSDQRRGSLKVLDKTMQGLENAVRNRLIVGVASSICQTNYDLLSEDWLKKLIQMGVHYAWFHTYRVVGPDPSAELALSPEQVLNVRRFIVEMRKKHPIAIVDAYWDDKGQALCPMATGVSHHIGPGGHIEPCPIIQFAKENIRDSDSVYDLITKSAFLKDFRETAAKATRGCVVLERPDLVRDIALRHGAIDSTLRKTAYEEMERLEPRTSQHNEGNEIPEEHWAYRFAKKNWFFGFGAYS